MERSDFLDAFHVKAALNRKKNLPIPQNLRQNVIKQYDRAIQNVDEGIGDLLDHLVELGLYDNTIIVLTSDHGEYFGEHGYIEHGKDVYQAAVAVPLIIKKPFQNSGELNESIVSSSDVPHIIFSLLPQKIDKQLLAEFSYIPDNHLIISENYYPPNVSTIPEGIDRIRTAVYDMPFKYIHSSKGDHELYNIVDDPDESHNIIAQHPEIAAKIVAKLQQFQNTSDRKEKKHEFPVLDDYYDKLRALRYMTE